jgi:hypothetical protein
MSDTFVRWLENQTPLGKWCCFGSYLFPVEQEAPAGRGLFVFSLIGGV